MASETTSRYIFDEYGWHTVYTTINDDGSVTAHVPGLTAVGPDGWRFGGPSLEEARQVLWHWRLHTGLL